MQPKVTLFSFCSSVFICCTSALDIPPWRRGLYLHTMSDKQEGALSHNKKRTRVSDHQERSASPPRCNPPPWTSAQTRKYVRSCSKTLPGPAESSSSSSDEVPSPLPGRGLGIQEARQWLLDSFNQSTIEEVLSQITSGVSSSAPTSDSQSAPTEHSGSAASSAASMSTTVVDPCVRRGSVGVTPVRALRVCCQPVCQIRAGRRRS